MLSELSEYIAHTRHIPHKASDLAAGGHSVRSVNDLPLLIGRQLGKIFERGRILRKRIAESERYLGTLFTVHKDHDLSHLLSVIIEIICANGRFHYYVDKSFGYFFAINHNL